MKILVINGSPKGKNSITLHTCLFLEKKFPGHTFTYITAHRFIEDNCADHKFFKSHGQYDFPQKKWKTSWMMYLIGGMMNNPKLKRKMGGKMSEGMIAHYKKILED